MVVEVTERRELMMRCIPAAYELGPLRFRPTTLSCDHAYLTL